MKKRKKTFKCNNCKDILPIKKTDYTKYRLVDARKYIDKKIVCERCFYRLKMDNQNIRKGTENKMVGLI